MTILRSAGLYSRMRTAIVKFRSFEYGTQRAVCDRSRMLVGYDSWCKVCSTRLEDCDINGQGEREMEQLNVMARLFYLFYTQSPSMLGMWGSFSLVRRRKAMTINDS